jgi:hypothetical protein
VPLASDFQGQAVVTRERVKAQRAGRCTNATVVFLLIL